MVNEWATHEGMKQMDAGTGFWRKLPEIIWRALVFIIAVAILIFVSTRWDYWEGSPGWKETDDAYLQADVTPIASKVAGYISELPVEDYERVHGGELLAQIVDVDYRAAVALGEANVASAIAQSDALKAQSVLQAANVQAARAVVAATAAQFEQNTRDQARQHRLLQSGSSSTEATEKLDTLRAPLSAQLAQNRAQADAAVRQLGVLAAQRAQANAAILAQRATLQTARLNLSYTHIVATQDGCRDGEQTWGRCHNLATILPKAGRHGLGRSRSAA